MNFYGLNLDEQQRKFVNAILDLDKTIVFCIAVGHTGQVDIGGRSGFARYIQHFSAADRCEVCELTINHRGWLSSYADRMEVW